MDVSSLKENIKAWVEGLDVSIYGDGVVILAQVECYLEDIAEAVEAIREKNDGSIREN